MDGKTGKILGRLGTKGRRKRMAAPKAFFRVSNLGLSSKKQVQLLYRRSLQLRFSWCNGDPERFQEEGWKIREKFRKNMDVTDPVQIKRLIQFGEDMLLENNHPGPYICIPFLNDLTL